MSIENKKGVYCLLFPNGKRYVGKSSSKYGIKSRFDKYRKYKCNDQPKLYNALKKYKSENVKFEIIIECNDDAKCKKIEAQLIAIWGLQNDKYGYNIGAGGEHDQYGLKRSNETKQKIGLRSKGNTYRLGKRHTDETKQKISKRNKGCVGHNLGKKFGKEFGEKISKIRKEKLANGSIARINKGSFFKGMIPWNKKTIPKEFDDYFSY